MAMFLSKYNGECKACGRPIIAREHYISWSRKARHSVRHADCANPTRRPESEQDGSQQQGEGQGSDGAQGESQQGSNGAEQSQGSQSQQAPSAKMDAAQARELMRNELAKAEAELERKIEKRLAERMVHTVTIKRESQDGATEEKRIENAHMTLSELVYLLQKRRHVYLHGPAGSGKSSGASMAAEALGLRYGYMSLNMWTPKSDIFGHPTPEGGWVEPEFVKLYEQGGVFCFDEVCLGNPALLGTLNGALDVNAHGVGYLGLPHRMVKRHENFMVVITDNTAGWGGDKQFAERRALDAAFRGRFVTLLWDYDLGLEERMVASVNPDAVKTWLPFVRSLRAFAKEQSIPLVAGPREAVNSALAAVDSGWSPRQIADRCIFKGIDVDIAERMLAECALPKA